MLLFTRQNSVGIVRCKMSGAWQIVLMILFCGGVSCCKVYSSDSQGLEALHALDAFVASNRLTSDEEILGMVGFDGHPLPVEWLVLTRRSGGDGSLHEYVCSADGVKHQRSISRLPGQNLPDLPLVRRSLLISSSQAFDLASARAQALHVSFVSVRYQLRVREEGEEPIWAIDFLDRSQVSLGILYLSASSGEVRRETWRQAEIKQRALSLAE